MRSSLTSSLVLLAAATAVLAAASDEVRDLPHRHGRLVADGDLADWRGDALVVELREPEAAAPLADSGVFRLAWDRDNLWFAAEIRDAEVFAPPADVSGSALYQWDSIELYCDGRGDRTRAMGSDDVQLIVSCDGRYAVMQGDPMLAKVEEWEVPKRLQPNLVVRTAARRTADGYVIEGALPLSAIGVDDPAPGRLLAVDVGWNDWTEDHPRLPELLKDLENLTELIAVDEESEVAIVDPDSVGWSGLLDWEERAYLPWSWRSGRDFGRPGAWALVRFAGGPPPLEALVDRWGVVTPLIVALAAMLGTGLAIDLARRRRYRGDVRRLMARIERLTAEASSPTEDPSPAADPASHATDRSHCESPELLVRVGDRLAAEAEDAEAPQDVVDRLLLLVRDRIAEHLTVSAAAEAVGVSARTLQRACRLEFGAGPRDVILSIKMQRAVDLLSSGRWRVSEVSEAIGFDDPYHFSHRFKDLMGRPPSSLIPSHRPDDS